MKRRTGMVIKRDVISSPNGEHRTLPIYLPDH